MVTCSRSESGTTETRGCAVFPRAPRGLGAAARRGAVRRAQRGAPPRGPALCVRAGPVRTGGGMFHALSAALIAGCGSET